MRIAAVRTALPPNYYDQETLLEALLRYWGDRRVNAQRVRQIHRNVLVGGRHLALPIPEYYGLKSWGEHNDAWIRVATDLAERASRDALDDAGFEPADVGAIFFVSVTGVAAPSIDARLMNRIPFPRTVKRLPVFGLGCVAGAAGIARAADYVRAFPDEVALLVSVELCSLTIQKEDLSVANLIASGLFGDGAAVAVVAGERRAGPGPRIVATRSVFYPDTEEAMGWRVTDRGFSVVLSPEVPEIARTRLRADVDPFLAEHGLRREDIAAWIAHPGGPKVIDAVAEALEIPAADAEIARRSLREVGNLSSASVLFVLRDVMSNGCPAPGCHGLLLAMGPGFCSELVLLRW